MGLQSISPRLPTLRFRAKVSRGPILMRQAPQQPPDAIAHLRSKSPLLRPLLLHFVTLSSKLTARFTALGNDA